MAVAVHDGHALRPEVEGVMALGDAERRREEDPFTGRWTDVAPTRITGLNSRFEVDLNRPRDKAVYLTPEDAWGLEVWRKPPDDKLVNDSLAQYDAFYRVVKETLTELSDRFGHFVVYDLHSYNHRRDGPDGAVADPSKNPEVNIGTGSLDRERWAPVVDRFISDLRAFDFLGRQLDVRENVKFKGGQVPKWVHSTFPDAGCALAIEFKKFFMDEWTGEPDEVQLKAIKEALASTVPGVIETLTQL